MPRMGERLARGIYRVATWLLQPLVFAYFWFRGRREPGYRQCWRERLGYVDGLPKHATWIHAASVGEVTLAQPLVHALAERAPDRPVVVSTFTPTGRERARTRLGDAVSHCYLPLDTHAATRRFMRRLQPHCCVIIETELWPNLLAAAARDQVPVAIANASMSRRSARRYRQPWLAPLLRPALAGVTAIGAAARIHAQRFEALGASRDRIRVTGNLKYDIIPDPQLPAAGAALRREWQAEQRPVWVAASTHPGEEEAVLAAHRRLRCHLGNALLVLAPRHPQRFDTVRRLIQQQGWQFAARAAGETVNAEIEVVLGDTLGDVPLFYALSDAAFVGGSLVPGIGGHNMLEAAALSRPMVTGPHTRDWQDIVQTLTAAHAMRVAEDGEALAACLRPWLDAPDAARSAGEAAHACFEAERGSLKRLVALLEQTAGL